MSTENGCTITNGMSAVRKGIYLAAGIALTILAVVVSEGFMIMTVKFFGVVKAALIRVLFTIPLSWLVIYLADKCAKNNFFQAWLEKKKAHLSKRALAIVKGGEAIAIVNTAIFLGPILASILMLMIGIETRKIYFYAVLCALFCAWVWCAFYSGMLWGVTKVF